MRRKPALASLAATTALLISATFAFAASSSRVSSGSPSGNTPQNHQNEPAVALDAQSPNILVAGSNDFVDEQRCPQPLAVNNGTCLDRATPVGVSGVYFSFDSGHNWTQPTYTGWTNFDCDPTTVCKGHPGPIHTLPWYAENQLVSFGDPAVAVGPAPDSDGAFSWSNGHRVYYANLTSAFSTTVEFSFPNPVFHGFLAVAVSRLDNPTPASVADKASWQTPVIVSSTTGETSFLDKEQIWADNAASSQFFGNVYICGNDFRSNGPHQNGNAPVPVMVYSSTDGGSTWTKRQVTSAVTNGISPQNGFGYSGCTLRTDSHGVVYLFAERFALPTTLPTHSAQVMFQSFDGGIHWTAGSVIANVTDPCYFIDPIEGRCVMDGFSGARTDLAASPSVSIANGAPTGAGASNEIVDAWADAPVLNGEVTKFQFSTDAGATWSDPQTVSLGGDRPLYAAPAISPSGSRAYVIYEADTAPWRGSDFTSPRPYHGVLVSSALDASGAPTGWHTVFNESPGDLRATYPGHDLYQERVGDYVYAAASDTYGVGVWTSAANAALCPAVQKYRSDSFAAGHRALPGAPWPLTDCPATFGNTDIMSASTA
ncbi:MAG: hypothetical protein E6J01_04615 [Chloroflexi bacterium]|nr:MAG: hypothetical protein E6J01_04615 [Chloroflexota bacterium]